MKTFTQFLTENTDDHGRAYRSGYTHATHGKKNEPTAFGKGPSLRQAYSKGYTDGTRDLKADQTGETNRKKLGLK